MVPELLSALTLMLSVDEYMITSAPALLVSVPLTFTVFVPPENPVLNSPELLTLPVIDRVVVVDERSDSDTVPPLAMVRVPLVGVTVFVIPFCSVSVPSTLFNFARAWVVVLPFLTLNVPPML